MRESDGGRLDTKGDSKRLQGFVQYWLLFVFGQAFEGVVMLHNIRNPGLRFSFRNPQAQVLGNSIDNRAVHLNGREQCEQINSHHHVLLSRPLLVMLALAQLLLVNLVARQ